MNYYCSPGHGGTNAGEYSMYPEVVGAEHAADSSPQVRTSTNITEDHALETKVANDGRQYHHALPYQQQQQPLYDGQQHQQQQYNNQQSSPLNYGTGTAGMAGAGLGSGTLSSPGLQSPTTTVATSAADTADIGGTKKPAILEVKPPYESEGSAGAAAGAAGAAHGGKGHKTYSRKVVIGLIGLLFLVLVLAGVIGGVVGSKAVSDAKAQCAASAAAMATVTATTTSSANPSTETFTVPTVGFVELDCPTLDGATSTVDMGTASPAFDLSCGSGFSRGGGSDLVAIISYSFYHCLQACASLNLNSGQTVCVGAEFDSDLSTAFMYGGNCFLSNSTSEITSVSSSDKKIKLVGLLQGGS